MNIKGLFLSQGILSQIGDRMWFFAAYLLLAKAFPTEKLILGGVYGLSISVTSALFSSSVGVWIDKTPRLKAAIILLCTQNLSVAVCATVQILGILKVFPESASIWLIGVATTLSCIGHLASIGVQIVLERDWIPQVFNGEDLTSINAWIRRIDQTCMLLGPAMAGPLIGVSAVAGAGLIAGWNVLSLIAEIFIMRTIYASSDNLQQEPYRESEPESGLKEWGKSWPNWLKSQAFIPGLALAILYANAFQLSYVAQAYIATHCVSDNLMGFAWMAAGVFGLLGTSFYEIIVKSYGVVSAGVAGALMHLFFVIGTIGGLFIKGSPYVLYHQMNGDDYECPDFNHTRTFYPGETNTTIFEDERGFKLEQNMALDYSSECDPVPSVWSILTLIVCCALSRCGLWLFDLAVNQMFQEWVPEDQRGTISGAQNGVQNLFDCVHFGLVFVFSAQCDFGHAMIITFMMMVFGYGYFFVSVGRGKFDKKVPTKALDSKAEEIVILHQDTL